MEWADFALESKCEQNPQKAKKPREGKLSYQLERRFASMSTRDL